MHPPRPRSLHARPSRQAPLDLQQRPTNLIAQAHLPALRTTDTNTTARTRSASVLLDAVVVLFGFVAADADGGVAAQVVFLVGASVVVAVAVAGCGGVGAGGVVGDGGVRVGGA